MSCYDAAIQVIEPAFANEYINIERLYKNSDFSNANTGDSYVFSSVSPNLLGKYLKNNIKASMSSNFGVNMSAEDIMRKSTRLKNAIKV